MKCMDDRSAVRENTEREFLVAASVTAVICLCSQ